MYAFVANTVMKNTSNTTKTTVSDINYVDDTGEALQEYQTIPGMILLNKL